MRKQLYLRFLAVCVVFWRGIVVSSERNEGASSTLLDRQKRASSSSAQYFRLHSPERHSREVGRVSPGRWLGPLLPGMVRIYFGNTEVGIGVVVAIHVIVTKAHFFHNGNQEGEYHVEFRGNRGETLSCDIIRVKPSRVYIKNEEKPWGPHDVAMADTDGDLQQVPIVSEVLKATGLFTREQVFWIGGRTGCLDLPDSFDL